VCSQVSRVGMCMCTCVCMCTFVCVCVYLCVSSGFLCQGYRSSHLHPDTSVNLEIFSVFGKVVIIRFIVWCLPPTSHEVSHVKFNQKTAEISKEAPGVGS